MYDTFGAATYNVFAKTPASKIEPVIIRSQKRDCKLWFCQEAGSPDIESMFQGLGLRTYNYGQHRMAWDPEYWTAVFKESVRLSNTDYATKDGPNVHSEAARVILCDPMGHSLDCVDYHFPAHIQVRHIQAPKRLIATRESMRKLERLADDSECLGFLAAGDDNVDEYRGIGAETGRWDFMLAHDTGLRQVRAPEGTHGERKIDDFRYPVGGRIKVVPNSKYVLDAPGDHRLFGATFRWRL